MRSLASIQRVVAITPIEGAEFIETARILGWQVVIKKGEATVGQDMVFFEVDSLLPEQPAFEFMRKNKFRVRTVKMRGCLSQGLALPLHLFGLDKTPVGTDVTEQLGVVKYELPPSTYGLAAGPFPGWITKTDEMRIQSVPELLDELRGTEVCATVKMDGTSGTFGIGPDDEFYVCSRSLRLKEDNTEANAHWRAARSLDIESKLRAAIPQYGRLALQGEICGPNIQSNRIGLRAVTVFVFNVFSVDNGSFFGPKESLDILGVLKIPSVPEAYPAWKLDDTVESLLEKAKGTYANGSPREGIVIRPLKEMNSTVLCGRCSFKTINNDFLLKHNE